MQFSEFKKYIVVIVSEGERLQRFDNTGRKIRTKIFLDSQIVSGLIALIAVFTLPKGFSDSFAGFVSGFLGIFVGLFTTILISMEEKRNSLYGSWDKVDEIKRPKIEITRNYMVRFTGLTSYSILIALLIVILLLLTLTGGIFNTDICAYKYIKSINEFTFLALGEFGIVLVVVLHRFLIVYFLCKFFLITIFSITSYFSRVLKDYNDLKPPC